MLLFVAILFSIGIADVSNVLQMPVYAKAVFVSFALLAVALSLNWEMRAASVPRYGLMINALLLFQLATCLMCLYPLVHAVHVEFSFTALFLQGLAPLIIVFSLLKGRIWRSAQALKALAATLGMFVFAALIASALPLGEIYTSAKYDFTGSVSAGSDFVRRCLPMCPGVVVGGVISGGLFSLGSIVVIKRANERNYKAMVASLGLIIVGGTGLFLTGFRGGIVAAIIAVVASLSVVTLGSRRVSQLVGLSLAGISIAVPFVYPSIQGWLQAYAPDVGADFLTRGDNSEAFTLAGRANIWRIAGMAIESPGQFTFGAGPSAELTLGLHRLFNIAVNNVDSLNPYLGHFHNMSLNLLYSGGLVTLALFWVCWLLAWFGASASESANTESSALTLAMLAYIALAGVTESLMSLSYIYPSLLFVLVVCCWVNDARHRWLNQTA